MNVVERAWYLPAGCTPRCLWPSVAVQLPAPPQQVEKKGLILKYTKGKMTWGTFFRSTATVSLPTGGTRADHAGDGSAWMVESFTKTSVLFGWFKYFQKHGLSQSSYFIKPLQISTVFLLFFHVDMEARGEEKCGHMYVFNFLFPSVMAFSGMKTNQVPFLWDVVSLDFSRSFGEKQEVLKKHHPRYCVGTTLMT